MSWRRSKKKGRKGLLHQTTGEQAEDRPGGTQERGPTLREREVQDEREGQGAGGTPQGKVRVHESALPARLLQMIWVQN